jgi:ubiquinone/menaquinone biosynthesis C-methylase UbiE
MNFLCTGEKMTMRIDNIIDSAVKGMMTVTIADKVIDKIENVYNIILTETKVVRIILDKIVRKCGRFKLSVDLGCGEGKYWLKYYSDYIIGVDHNKYQLETARMRYDEVVLKDIRKFRIPDYCDSIFMFQSIEHIPKEDGIRIIKNSGDRFMLITTPSRFVEFAQDHHVTLYTKSELESLGFKVLELYLPIYGNLVAVKREWKGGKIID